MKKLFIFTIVLSFIMCSFSAFAEEVAINECNSEDPVCIVLRSMYGNGSSIRYSLTETEVCKYSTSINVDGVPTTIYLSEKPYVGDLTQPTSPHEITEPTDDKLPVEQDVPLPIALLFGVIALISVVCIGIFKFKKKD